ncbi:hypothetical protein SAMN05421820_101121 [Pedobacter steynii]|uniref:Uncharacterized protein n=1 Tax=Pedobacter steynii TaxID=430522 RepID=A0A1G9J217_9SPHI|nr:hypothetical protein [Pedobacter steynii]NQX38114.1 hypothetical protein [Pedobacter steynii]SDL31361.1 hypothetical protein SAMN05421820_101121 [Pedobacter steynii]
MKIRYLILFALAIYGASCLRQVPQTNKEQKNVITPPPDASVFGQYGNAEIELDTGIPKIDISLYEDKEKDIS